MPWERLLRWAALSALAGAGVALGYGIAEWRRAPAGEAPLTQAEYCAGRATSLCELEYRNYLRAHEVGALLAERDCLLVTAESITVGGLVATIGRTRWAGLAVAGGIVAYDTAVKATLLDVSVDPGLSSGDAAAAVISAPDAIEMVNGLHELFRPLNRWREGAGYQRRACAYIALTGAATTWRGPPRLFIALRLGDASAEVAEHPLDGGLAGDPAERTTNIQIAIGHALEALRVRLATIPVADRHRSAGP